MTTCGKPINRHDFLCSIGDVNPEDVGAGPYSEIAQRLFDALRDARCINAATCPFFHPPSVEVFPDSENLPEGAS